MTDMAKDKDTTPESMQRPLEGVPPRDDRSTPLLHGLLAIL
jgi:hypothetical protein